MPVPTYDEFIFPLLRVLVKVNTGLRSRDAQDAVADLVQLSDEDRAQRIPSGQSMLKNRINWAHDRLKRAGFSRCPSRGVWQATEEGRKFVAEHPNGIDAATRDSLAFVALDEDEDGEDRGHKPAADGGTVNLPVESPEERIDSAVRAVEKSVASELLELVLASSPAFFERLVLDVLVKLGYGGRDLSVHQTGRSGDGGIDGVISLDRLGLEKVYVQAKRWQQGHNVGRPDIQAFYGALAGRRAKKGVFLTTSSFTAEAREFASQVSDSIVLVDGQTLTKLMIDCEVGVSVQRTVKIPRVDSDYFDEG